MRALWISLRPHQWVKNLLVFVGLIFSQSLLIRSEVRNSLIAFALFCCASSAIYLLNDVCDMKEDRKHPGKRLRPIAQGTLSPAVAIIAMLILAAVAVLGGFALNVPFGLVISAYLVLTVAYSMGLKKLVIVDVMLIAFGFVLRAVGGAVAVGVAASPWLVICTLLLALIVGFGKRRHELLLLESGAVDHRKTLESYSVEFLDMMVSISAGAAVVSYALYTMAAETIARVGSSGLLITTPCVIYGVFRYLYLVHEKSEGGDPALMFIKDRATLINGLMWLAAILLVLYGPFQWF
jgi:4-hydroxybenzoate polyprenyltransferase